jgi:hypothetical protein
MAFPTEETPLVLQGPRPEVPAGFWAEHGWLLALVVTLICVGGWLLRRRRRTPRPAAPAARLETALRAAETQPATEALATATQALRAYLAAVDRRAATSLSTEELLRALGDDPVFLPAWQPLTAALRGADAAKFAGAAPELPSLFADLREAVRRIEAARRVFTLPPVAPIVGPPPLPPRAAPAGPPPLPRRDLA